MPAATSVAIHYAPKPREKREKRKKGGKNAEAAVGEEIAEAGSDAVCYITDAGRHGTARLPELHGLELTLHRHPISHNTYVSLPIPLCHRTSPSAMALHTWKRVGQCLASATWNTCTHAHTEITVTPHRSP